MSKHETALALIDDQIERTEKDQSIAAEKVKMTQNAVSRAEKELQLIDWSLGELRASRAALLVDRQMQHGLEEPAEL